MPMYRQSQDQEIVYIRRPITTTTTIDAYGSGDNYTNPDTMFGTDETIMVAGAVVAEDGADLSAGTVSIRLNGTEVGVVALSYDGAGTNFYQFTLGILAEGDYTVEAFFARLRI